MKIKNLALYVAAIAATVTGMTTAEASFGVTLRTTTTAGLNTPVDRLFQDAALTDDSDATDPIWLVFDVDGDGIFVGGANGSTPASNYNIPVNGGATELRNAMIDADDYAIFTQGGPAGQVNKPFTGLDSALQTGGTGVNDAGGTVRPAYALIFEDAVYSDGGSFGFSGILAQSGTIPELGNVDLRIFQSMTSVGPDAIDFTAVPEPAAAAYVGLGLAGLALLRRRMARA
jgi:hypothetical protein